MLATLFVLLCVQGVLACWLIAVTAQDHRQLIADRRRLNELKESEGD
jgi:hypothetical protein